MEILDKQEQDVDRRPEHKKNVSGGIVVGLIFIIAGIVLIFSNAGWISSGLRRMILSWQMLLIAIGLVSLARKQFTQGIILLLIGVFFILPRIGSLGLVPGFEWFTRFNWGNMWPLALVAVGILIFTKSRRGEFPGAHHRCRPHGHTGRETTRFDNGYVDYSMVFSGSDNVFLEPVFRGGTIESVFGGATLDLRKTTLQEGVSYLKVSSVFGGITLFVPAEWNVEVQSESVFGSFKDNRPFTADVDKNSKLIIKAECVFGGGEIR